MFQSLLETNNSKRQQRLLIQLIKLLSRNAKIMFYNFAGVLNFASGQNNPLQKKQMNLPFLRYLFQHTEIQNKSV